MSWYDTALAGYYRSKIASADAMAQGIDALGTSIGRAIAETRYNQQANQIGSQMANSGAYAPRAALVSPGVNPDTGEQNQIEPGTPTAGTAPAQFTGGYRGLQMQTAIDALRSQMALRQAQTGYYGAHSQAIQENAATAAQRAQTYQQAVDQKNQDTLPKLLGELNNMYGKGSAGTILNAFDTDPSGAQYRGDIKDGNWVPNPNGSLFSPNAPKPSAASGGILGIGAHGEQPQPVDQKTIQIPWSMAQQYIQRYQNAAGGQGGQENQPAAGGGTIGTFKGHPVYNDRDSAPPGGYYSMDGKTVMQKPGQ